MPVHNFVNYVSDVHDVQWTGGNFQITEWAGVPVVMDPSMWQAEAPMVEHASLEQNLLMLAGASAEAPAAAPQGKHGVQQSGEPTRLMDNFIFGHGKQQASRSATVPSAPPSPSMGPEQSEADKRRRRCTPIADQHQAQELLANPACAWDLACKSGTSSSTVQQAVDIAADAIGSALAWEDWDAYDVAVRSAEALLAPIKGHVRDALAHRHANYVIQKVLDVMPTDLIAFVAIELKGFGFPTSTHRFGCRTMLRLVHHCHSGTWASGKASEVVSEILSRSSELCRDSFGNFVIREVLEHGTQAQRSKVAKALRQNLLQIAKSRHGSHIVEKALWHCEPEDTMALGNALVTGKDSLLKLAESDFGCHVIKALVSSKQHEALVMGHLSRMGPELRNSRPGRRLLDLLSGSK